MKFHSKTNIFVSDNSFDEFIAENPKIVTIDCKINDDGVFEKTGIKIAGLNFSHGKPK